MKLSGFSIIKWQSKMTFGRAFRSEATTGGPIVILGTKCPSIMSRWSTVPPPSRAAFASSASRAKFAERIEGTSSMVMGSARLLSFLDHADYTRNGSVVPQRSDLRAIQQGGIATPSRPAYVFCEGGKIKMGVRQVRSIRF